MIWFADHLYVHPQKLVDYLSYHYNVGKGIVYKFIREKKILINDKKINESYRVKYGDHLTIKYPLGQNIEPKSHRVEEPKVVNDIYSQYHHLLNKMIIFENEDFYIINKPVGWASQGGINNPLNLDDLFTYHNKNHYIVHRLDQDTSGLMIMAKTSLVAKDLSNLMEKKKINKYYKLLTPLMKENMWEYKNFIGITNEKNPEANSHTIFNKIQDIDDYSLWEATLMTGKKHQIRIHCFQKGIPILGDKKYRGENYDRLALHSYKLEFFYKENYKFLKDCSF